MFNRPDCGRSTNRRPLIDLIIAKDVVVSPTLFVMETRQGDARATKESVRGFQNMIKFVDICHRAGAKIVVDSHGAPPNAYYRELELLVECGLTPMEAILAGTKNNAEFFTKSPLPREFGYFANPLLFQCSSPSGIAAYYPRRLSCAIRRTRASIQHHPTRWILTQRQALPRALPFAWTRQQPLFMARGGRRRVRRNRPLSSCPVGAPRTAP